MSTKPPSYADFDARDRHSTRRDERRDDRDDHRRRRSRSPRHRRERDDNAYSSSRSYREREREDRHHRDRREDRRDERDYDRRDRRPRDRDDRPPRRDRGDRDLFDDRRGPRRDDFRSGRGGHDNAPRRSESPQPRRKEPTPDLADTTNILKRTRRQKQFDIKPGGYESISAEQAKHSGMFPLPGAPRQNAMDPEKLKALMNQPADAASKTALTVTESKQARRLFVRNIPPGVNESSLKDFFNNQLDSITVISTRGSCISCKMSPDRTAAMLEFSKPEDATIGYAMSGVVMPEHQANGAANGSSSGLDIRRPSDYIIPSYPEGIESDIVLDSSTKVMVTNIPPIVPESELSELLTAFGEHKRTLITDNATFTPDGFPMHKGIAFLQFQTAEDTAFAIDNLNDMELLEQRIRVGRACEGVSQADLELGSINTMSLLASMDSDASSERSRVVRLMNMVTTEELMNEELYLEIREDVEEEVQKYGTVLGLKIPRPTAGNRQNPGIGKIFVKFETPKQAMSAMQALSGRRFSERTVVVSYFGEDCFDVEAW